MGCRNCGSTLRALETVNWSICNHCDLIHDEHGDDLGWAVIIRDLPGGLIPRADIEKIVGRKVLDVADVAFTIRLAAEVGFSHIDEIQAAKAREEIEDMQDEVRRYGLVQKIPDEDT